LKSNRYALRDQTPVQSLQMTPLGKTISATSVCAALFILLPPAAYAKRVALVIGNSAYVNTPVLANPKNDAASMAAALTGLGFTVVQAIDRDKAGMDQSIRAFAGKLQDVDLAVFFFAGHGLQVSGRNYLVPVDAKLSTAAALEVEMIRLDDVQSVMEKSARARVIFLDACRDNPLQRNLTGQPASRSLDGGRGLAQVQAAAGTLISFATQPGNTASDGAGNNSPFTGALARHIVRPGSDLYDILIEVRNDVRQATAGRQLPWENSALTARLFLKDGPGGVREVRADPPAVSAPSGAWPRQPAAQASSHQCSVTSASSNGVFGAGVSPIETDAVHTALETCKASGGADCRVTAKVCR
jgi:Caspase domain